jgi:hypothetical protein
VDRILPACNDFAECSPELNLWRPKRGESNWLCQVMPISSARQAADRLHLEVTSAGRFAI